VPNRADQAGQRADRRSAGADLERASFRRDREDRAFIDARL
jgi:hypothetical protein